MSERVRGRGRGRWRGRRWRGAVRTARARCDHRPVGPALRKGITGGSCTRLGKMEKRDGGREERDATGERERMRGKRS